MGEPKVITSIGEFRSIVLAHAQRLEQEKRRVEALTSTAELLAEIADKALSELGSGENLDTARQVVAMCRETIAASKEADAKAGG